MKKCLLKFLWVKVPREETSALKGLLGYWLKLVSRAAFRKEKSSRSNIRDFLYPVLEQFAAGRRFCYPGGAYAVYNNRDHVLNWMGEGSRKIRNHPHFFTPMYNFSFPIREATLDREGSLRVVCLQEQIPFLKSYLGNKVTLSTVKMEAVERVFKIEERCLL